MSVLENIGHRGLQLRRLLRKDHAALKQKGAYLVDDCGAPRDEPVTNPMHRLEVELVIGLNRDEAHVLALDCLRDSFRIDEVVLVGLHKRLHELRRNQPHIVPLLLQDSPEEVCTGTGFETDQRGLHVRRERQQLLLCELLLHQNLARCSQRYKVKRRLAQVDAYRTNLHVDDPP